MAQQCPECGKIIIGRVDKKFCNDGCRNAYNNKLNKDNSNLIRNVNNVLRKNYRILLKLNPDQKTTIPKSKLLDMGFDFNYFTNTYTTKSGTVYFFVYNQGYLPIENNFVALVKRE